MTDVAEQPMEFVDFWNEVLAPKFIRYRHILVDGLSGHSEAVAERWGVEPGHHIVDVGCGFGDTAIQLARLTGTSGSVLGLDCCQAFLDLAEEDAVSSDVQNLRFRVADAATCEWDRQYDFCFSRFGAMFFENPVWGLRNMGASLKPGGRLMLLVWRSIEENPWFKIPKDIVLQFLPPPGDGAKSCGPGPFSMADQEIVTMQLEKAGFTDIGFEAIDSPVVVGRDVEDAIGFQLALGPAGEVYREAGDAAEAVEDELREALRSRLTEDLTTSGVVMDSASWCITARRAE